MALPCAALAQSTDPLTEAEVDIPAEAPSPRALTVELVDGEATLHWVSRTDATYHLELAYRLGYIVRTWTEGPLTEDGVHRLTLPPQAWLQQPGPGQHPLAPAERAYPARLYVTLVEEVPGVYQGATLGRVRLEVQHPGPASSGQGLEHAAEAALEHSPIFSEAADREVIEAIVLYSEGPVEPDESVVNLDRPWSPPPADETNEEVQ
ncbi:MAG: hypothetical protein JXX28_11630 [Deltaproteobacteria bacterium]|nr:hypothetical protein [Deltaproteobacteria bacterium]